MAKRWIEILANVIFWVASAWLLISGFSVVSIEHTIDNGIESQIIRKDSTLILQMALAIGLSFVLFYINLKLINSRQLTGSIWKTSLFSLSAFVIVIAFFHILAPFISVDENLLMPTSLIMGVFSFYYTISIAYGLGKSWLKSEALRKNLLLEKNQAQLSLLRNQLQPHFLFNALNNLLSMINQQQFSGASDAIEKLALLLRYVIEETKADKVSLSKEIRFIENYSALQMLRFDPQEVDLNISVLGKPDNYFVEPGLFLPFVENAFKYGAAPELKSKIIIQFDLSHDSVIDFSVSNTLINNNIVQGTGTGIEATSNRLNLVYPDRYTLDITNNDGFTVYLKIFN